MTARVSSHLSSTSRQIRVGANVSGFVLDLDSTIPDHVFSLIEVYREGKARMARLTTLPRNQSAVSPDPLVATVDTPNRHVAPTTSNILASLIFLSGKIRFHSRATTSALSRTRLQPYASPERLDEHLSDLGADIFRLPVVSVWGEYRAARIVQNVDSSGDAEPAILMFKSTVHASQNSIRPTLLPFLTELVNNIDEHLRRVNTGNLPLQTDIVQEAMPNDDDAITDAVSSMQISFSLRIDQSKLELTCQPDVNVIAGLHWDSGGFIVNTSPGARNVTFTGSVGGLTVGLKHGFLSEDCVRLDAHNLAFSLTFARREDQAGNPISSISIVVDTEFSGAVRFSRFQDVLCFKAVWLDRIPIFTAQDVGPPKSPAKPPTTPSAPPSIKFPLATAFLFRVRHIKLDVELGQSISAVTIDLRNAFVRTKLTTALHEFSLFVADASVNAKGNVSGHATLPNFVFQTIRRKETKPVGSNGRPKMLELSMTSGALHIMLESDHQMLLQYQSVMVITSILQEGYTNCIRT
jgi:hypothetical protein